MHSLVTENHNEPQVSKGLVVADTLTVGHRELWLGFQDLKGSARPGSWPLAWPSSMCLLPPWPLNHTKMPQGL